MRQHAISFSESKKDNNIKWFPVQAHPDEARAGIAKLSTAAQQPAGEIVKIFCSDKDPLVKVNEIKHIKVLLYVYIYYL